MSEEPGESVEDALAGGASRPRRARSGARAHEARLLVAALLGATLTLLAATLSAPAAGAHLLHPARSRGGLRPARPRGGLRPARPRGGLRAAHPRGGRVARAAIVGGQVAGAGTFPWLAYVLDFKGQQVGQCTGTVIAANLVLTAGHCGEEPETGTINPASGYRVVSATTDWAAESERQVSGVSRVIVYPGFDTGTLTGDAALLVLSTPTSAPPIALAREGESGLSAAGTEAVVAGWGQTYPEEESLTQRLRWAATVVQRAGYCERNAAPFHPGLELCAIDPPSFATGPCEGDSGGPLIANGASGPVEIGLVSHGPADCATTQPSVYTRVDSIAAWAGEWIAALNPGSSPPPVPVPATTTTPVSTSPPSPSQQPAAPAPAKPPRPAFPRVAAPLDGRYRGSAGGARSPIALVIGSHGTRLTAIAARLRYRCGSARTLRSSVEALSNGETQPIGRRGRFLLRLAAGRERVTIAGGVGESAGVLRGTITGVDRTRGGARCSTGRISWTATRSRAAPRSGSLTRPGAYRGLTEQGRPLAVRVAHSGRRLVRLRFTAVYRCPGGRRVRLTRTLLSLRRTAALESPGSFTVEITTGSARGRVDGTFGLLSGVAFGTLRAAVRTRHGRCQTGLVGWQARR